MSDEREKQEDILSADLDLQQTINPEDIHESMEIEMKHPDGTVIRYEVLGVFVTEDEHQYMAMHDVDSNDESSVSLFPYVEGKNGLLEFVDFEDDDEYQKAIDAFTEYFVNDEEGFAEME